MGPLPPLAYLARQVYELEDPLIVEVVPRYSFFLLRRGFLLPVYYLEPRQSPFERSTQNFLSFVNPFPRRI